MVNIIKSDAELCTHRGSENTTEVIMDADDTDVRFFTDSESTQNLYTAGVTGCIAIMFHGLVTGRDKVNAKYTFPMIAMKHWSGFDPEQSEQSKPEQLEFIISYLSKMSDDIRTEMESDLKLDMVKLSVTDVVIIGGEKKNTDISDPEASTSGTEREVNMLRQIFNYNDNTDDPIPAETQQLINRLWADDDIFKEDEALPSRAKFCNANVVFNNFVNETHNVGFDWGGIDIVQTRDSIHWHIVQPTPSAQFRM